MGFPAAIRIQGTDIIRTWAFYTIFRTWALTGNKPWESIIAHSMILGTDGREMHKSWGNGVYPDKLLEKYDPDEIRLWVALCGGIVKDKAFSYQDMDYAKTFATKLHNTVRFVQITLEKGHFPKADAEKSLNVFDLWILNRFNSVVKEATESYGEYNLYEAASKMVNFYWHEFADYYIENVKHRVYSDDPSDDKSKVAALFTLKYVCTNMLKILAPIMPFLCEEENEGFFTNRSLFEEEWPKYTEPPTGAGYAINGVISKGGSVAIGYESAGAFLNSIISEVRQAKAKGKKALNYEISSININVPEEYYSVTFSSKEELMRICKAKAAVISKGEYSVKVDI